MKRAVVVICDGLRDDMVTPDLTPNLCRIAAHGTRFDGHRGIFPSTTRTTSASIATGCLPGRHGLEGNAMALDLGDGLEVFSVGPPAFRDKLQQATGRTLKVPVMAERLKHAGGAVIYSNVSPGAAIFQDPDGHGHMQHRSHATGPGRTPAAPLSVSHDAEGDAAMTRRFIDDVLQGSKPALALLWLCEPDHTQHGVALGSPAHLDVIRAADAQAGRVFDNVQAGIDAKEILLLCASDHGHESVGEVVDIENILIEAGFKDGAGSRDVAIAPQGTSATIYLAAEAKARRDDIVRLLEADPRIGGIWFGDAISELGLDPKGGIDIVVTGRSRETASEHGIPGTSVAFQGSIKISNNIGCGQHGGMGRYEQNPFLIACGPGFGKGERLVAGSSAVDLAPSVLAHLGQSVDGMDGRPLQAVG
ncbi:MAG: alkaline phosphatase family protein [Proteobacteria bacterium]|nr:alkaline phosphatase family protein [Pseudomonadota bacterium]